jgi:hypothetical protein
VHLFQSIVLLFRVDPFQNFTKNAVKNITSLLMAMPDNDGMVSSEDVGSSSEHETKYEASPAYTIDPESGVVHFGDGDVGEKPPTGVSISAHYEGSGDPGSQDRRDDGYDDSSLKEEDKESRDEDNPRDASNDTDSNGEREPPSDRSNR